MDFNHGNIEIAIASILFILNISLYELINETDTSYTHYTNIWKDINDPSFEIMVVLFSNHNNFS